MAGDDTKPFADVDVRWDGSVRLKAVTPLGDPVELTAEGAFELAETLLRLWRTPHPPADRRDDDRHARIEAAWAARPVAALPFAVFAIDEHVSVWFDGTPCLKAVTSGGAPVALSDEAVLDLVEALIRVARAPVPPPQPR